MPRPSVPPCCAPIAGHPAAKENRSRRGGGPRARPLAKSPPLDAPSPTRLTPLSIGSDHRTTQSTSNPRSQRQVAPPKPPLRPRRAHSQAQLRAAQHPPFCGVTAGRTRGEREGSQACGKAAPGFRPSQAHAQAGRGGERVRGRSRSVGPWDALRGCCGGGGGVSAAWPAREGQTGMGDRRGSLCPALTPHLASRTLQLRPNTTNTPRHPAHTIG